jgi:methionine--tRNA ligase beta chain
MDNISFDDFGKVDIRIGTVIKADVPEWSHWVIRMEVDLGPEIGKKKAFSGIMKFFKPEDLEGKQFPFVINLEPKKIGPDRELSEVMMIMATPEDPTSLKLRGASEETPTILFKLQKKVPNGTKVR